MSSWTTLQVPSSIYIRKWTLNKVVRTVLSCEVNSRRTTLNLNPLPTYYESAEQKRANYSPCLAVGWEKTMMGWDISFSFSVYFSTFSVCAWVFLSLSLSYIYIYIYIEREREIKSNLAGSSSKISILYINYPKYIFLEDSAFIGHWRCPLCNGYRRRKRTRRYEFKSWTRLIAFHIALMPLGKVWIQLFSLQLWINSRAE